MSEKIRPHNRTPMLRRDYASKRMGQILAKKLSKLHADNFSTSETFIIEKNIVTTCPFAFNFTEHNDKTPEGRWHYNIAFRDAINAQWRTLQNSNNEGELFKLAKWMVEKWGHINGNKDETLLDYVKRSKHAIIEKTDKMSSYSKILSAINRHKYQIFDARTAVCLNVMQLDFFAGTRYYLQVSNQDSSRNKKIDEFYEAFPKSEFMRIGYKPIYSTLNITSYRFYLDLVDDIALRMNEEPIVVEQMLFTYSELLVTNLEEIAEKFRANREWLTKRDAYWRSRGKYKRPEYMKEILSETADS